MAQAAGESETRPFLTMSRAALWGWVAGVFAISAGMFVLGVMVGRGTAPIEFDIDRLKRAVEAAGRAASAEKPQAAAQPEMKRKTDLGFYDSLVRGPEEKPAVPQAPRAEKTKEAEPRAKEPAAPPPPERKPAAAAPSPPAVSPAPGPAPAPSTAGRTFTVQVAALASEEEARGLAARLRQRGYAAYVEPVSSAAGGKIFRVRMGEYPTRDFARGLVERLRRDGFPAEAVAK